jgi:hypothetical protein
MIQYLRRTWHRVCFPSWTVPLGLLILLGASFGPLISWLGFYWDDWPAIFTGQLHGLDGFWRFFAYNRPFSAWIYVVTYPLLGNKPLNWQIFALALRYLTCVNLWWALSLTWPRHKYLAAWTAFLFAIYPIFAQQSISVAYTQHWTCYLLFLFSMAGMLLAQRLSRRSSPWFWPVTLIALAAFLLEIFSMEYFAGLELLRPLLLWIVVAEEPGSRASRVKAILKAWLPYLMGIIAFAVWRFSLVRLANPKVNTPNLLKQMLLTPFDSMNHLVEMAMQDLLYLFARVWTDLLNTTIDLNDRFMILTWGIAILVLIATFIYLNRMEQSDREATGRFPIYYQGMLIGAFAAVLGILPIWATDRQATAGMYADRFGLASMWGTSLFLASLIGWLFSDRRKQIMILSLLVGLAAGYHLQTANAYRWSWTRQARFYWQLKWRAPQLEPNTAIFSEGEIFMYNGIYPTSLAVNLLYLNQTNTDQVPYWFYSLGRNFAYNMPDFKKGMIIQGSHRNYMFQGNSHEGIVIQFVPDNDCLEILAPGDETAPGLEAFTRQAVPYSNLARISPGPANPGTPSTDIFGPEPEHGWCYLYEKGSLARQQGDWDQVVKLSEQARASGYNPKSSSSNTSFEWLPFIEGYARTGRWQDAQDISLAAFEKDRRIDARMCSLWNTMSSSTPTNPAKDAAITAVRNQIKCP